MKEEQILAAIKDLAQSQGSYGRMYRDLMQAKETNPEGYGEYMAHLESINFKDTLDLILFIEQ